MKRTKVLRIIARLNIGGPAMHTIFLTEGIDKNRFQTLLVAGMVEKAEGDMSYLVEEKGIRPVIIPELGRTLNMRNDVIAFWKLFCLIKKESPDIIHTHTAKAGTLGRLGGMLYGLISGRKRCILIHTFHGHVLHNYFGRIKSTIFTWIERFLAIFTDKIVAVSENLREELIELKIGGPKKIVTIHLGLDLEKYLKIQNNKPSLKDYKTVGIIGRLVPIKNHKMFLDVARRLKDMLGTMQKVKFLIVGDGLLRQDLENYAKRLGIEQDVSFLGWVKDLAKVYSELDIVALTSLNEGTPVALIEAEASARACVATDVGGVRNLLETVCQEVNLPSDRILIRSKDIEGFSKALSLLLNDSNLRERFGRAGRKFVKTKFTKERLIKDIEKLYNKCL
jgi:glycosyltransferase involved in cell wall biosynthesis